MTAIAYDPYASVEKAAAQGVELVTFDDALKRADFHSLHMPLTPATKNLFNDDVFEKMKRGSRIINVARGGVIDEAALVRALDAKKVAAAALDVFEQEPPNFESESGVYGTSPCHLGTSVLQTRKFVAMLLCIAYKGRGTSM